MIWVYDVRGLDLADWAARAAPELQATAAPGDHVIMLLDDTAEMARLVDALTVAGYAPRLTYTFGAPSVSLQVPSSP